MSKTEKHCSYRVVVEPRRLGDFGSMSVSDSLLCLDEEHRQRLYQERCQEIVDDIKRHVDSVGDVTIECDNYSVCEHCGSTWTEADHSYNAGCCSLDQLAQDNKLSVGKEAA